MTNQSTQDRGSDMEPSAAVEGQTGEGSISQATSHDTQVERLFRQAFDADRPQMSQGDGQIKRMSSLPRRPLNAEPRGELE